jgi:pyruvate dehydrogenase E2 component (dihydrolipoamide acetyltransferase)
MGEFRMPSLGADMDRGTVVEWRVQPGDTVHRGDIVAVVDTDKADVEVEVFEDGTVEALLVPEGTEVEVGTPLAVITGTGSSPVERAEEPSGPTPPVAAGPGPPAPERRAPIDSGRQRISPRARRLAAEHGVEPDTIAAAATTGTVTGADIEHLVGASGAVTAGPADRPTAMRAAIARSMARSNREIPHYYLATEIDFSHARSFLDERNASRPVTERLLPAALLLKATALAAREVPECNGFWVDDAPVPSDAVHVGVAVSLRGGGLVAPAIHDADRKTLDELMAGLRDLVNRARAGSLRASEMSDPTITVTNLGEQGVQLVHGVIFPPQVALVGFGAILPRPWTDGEGIDVRPVVTATLAGDHRASDGARGAAFLRHVDRGLRSPEDL